jgi:hypothetical protein
MQEVKPAMAPMQEVKPAAMPVAETKPMMEDKPMMEAKPMTAAPATETSNWVVTAAEKTGFDTYFNGADADHDGYVTGCRAASLGASDVLAGVEVMGIFASSKLPKPVLAQIWCGCCRLFALGVNFAGTSWTSTRMAGSTLSSLRLQCTLSAARLVETSPCIGADTHDGTGQGRRDPRFPDA